MPPSTEIRRKAMTNSRKTVSALALAATTVTAITFAASSALSAVPPHNAGRSPVITGGLNGVTGSNGSKFHPPAHPILGGTLNPGIGGTTQPTCPRLPICHERPPVGGVGGSGSGGSATGGGTGGQMPPKTPPVTFGGNPPRYHDPDHDHDRWYRWPPVVVVEQPGTVAVSPSVRSEGTVRLSVAAPAANSAAVPQVTEPEAVANNCNCLTKQTLRDGSVLFADICTKESAIAPAQTVGSR
jgi:hypothetical protein